MKTRVYLLIAVLLTTSLTARSQSESVFSDAPMTYRSLMKFAKKSAEESLSEGDFFSLIANEIVLQEFDKTKKDKILEIKCTLNKYNEISEVFTTVHRDIIKSDKEGFKMDNSFFILQDISLSNVKNIQFEIVVRSVTEKQSKVFGIVSNLINKATASNPAIQTVRDLLNVDVDESEAYKSDANLPVFNATLHIPNNYINYYQINKDLNLPLLKPDISLPIAFKSKSNNVPKNYLKRFANLVVKEAFVDKEEIGGVIVLNATKKTPKPIVPVVQRELFKLYNHIKSNEFDKLNNAIISSKNTLDIAYSDELDKRSSAYRSAHFYITLVDCYDKYINSDAGNNRKDFNKKFESWVIDKIEYGSDHYLDISIKGLYKPASNDDANKIRVVDFFIPNNLPNELLTQSFVFQKLMHSNFNAREDRDKFISSITESINLNQ